MSKEGFTDTHCHLDFDVFSKDRKQVLAQSLSVGVNRFIVPGVQPSQWGSLRTLSEQFPALYYAVGIHPWWVSPEDTLCFPSSLELLGKEVLEFLKDDKCVAIGECGLDKQKITSINEQSAVFEWHCDLAKSTRKPLIVHSVKTHSEVLAVLKSKSIDSGGVIHAYSGSEQTAKQFWDKGFYLGIGGTITYPRANKTRQAVKALPLDSMLLETDSPDMPLSGFQGKRNCPERIIDVARCLAEIKNVSLDRVMEVTSRNAERLFGF